MPLKIIAEFAVIALCMFLALRTRLSIGPVKGRLLAFARRKALVCVGAALLVIGIRAALLPVWPAPKPSIYDEFSYLLQSDTFAHGRITNPPHPMWQFFESIYVLQQPTYASKYPPGQGIAMAAGQMLTGNAWAGVLLSCGLLAAAICWALQGWVPAVWAVVGSLISLQLCTYSYWMNSYWGGAVAAIGGALVIGAYGRISRRIERRRYLGWMFGIGLVILLLTRPYEGFLLASPVCAVLWFRIKGHRSGFWIPVAVVLLAGASWDALYDYRVTGHPLRMPYQEYFAQYESVPPLTILPVQPTKAFRHFDLEFLDSGWTRDQNGKAHSWQLLKQRGHDLYETAGIIFGDPLWLPILAAGIPAWVFRRRTRLLAGLAGLLLAGAAIELVFYAHYAAPFAAALLIALLESLRYLRVWLRRHIASSAAGADLVIAGLLVALLGGGVASDAHHIYIGDTPDHRQAVNARKGDVERTLLANHPGRHVIFVRYTGTQNPHEEWIYNLSDIDSQQVIWAQDMGAENSKLVVYYPGRTFWMFQPDVDAAYLAPYGQGLRP